MFIHHLNKAQKEALYCFSKKLIAVDGYVDEREALILKTIRDQCEPDVDLVSNVELSDLTTLLLDQKSKMAFLLELVGVAYADEHFHEAEEGLVEQVANSISVSVSLLNNLKVWVEKQMILLKEAQQFIEV